MSRAEYYKRPKILYYSSISCSGLNRTKKISICTDIGLSNICRLDFVRRRFDKISDSNLEIRAHWPYIPDLRVIEYGFSEKDYCKSVLVYN
jgi:hypothetical protein